MFHSLSRCDYEAASILMSMRASNSLVDQTPPSAATTAALTTLVETLVSAPTAAAAPDTVNVPEKSIAAVEGPAPQETNGKRKALKRAQNAKKADVPAYIEGQDYDQPIPDPDNWTAGHRKAGCIPVYPYYSTKDPNTHLVVGKYPAVPETATHRGSRGGQDTNPHLATILLSRYGHLTKARMQNTMEKWSLTKQAELEQEGPAARDRHDNSLRHALTVSERFRKTGAEEWRLATREELAGGGAGESTVAAQPRATLKRKRGGAKRAVETPAPVREEPAEAERVDNPQPELDWDPTIVPIPKWKTVN